MEAGKIWTSYIIENDAEMYSLTEDKHCQCLNLNIHEDLGIVKHIFADKTGTLTNNMLTFKGATIENHYFCEDKGPNI
jgi:phospholipid-transporting ATPase